MIIKIINSIVFIVAISAMWIFYFLYNPTRKDLEYHDGKAYLTSEKRSLALMPTFSFKNYISGNWAKDFDAFVNDNFPFRSSMSDMAVKLRSLRGFELRESEKVIFIEDYNTNIEIDPVDTTALEKEAVEGLDESYKHGMLIVDGKVFPMGGGNPSLSIHFAEMLSDYSLQLQGECRVISMVPPLSSAFIPSSDYKYLNRQNEKTLLAIKENLTNGVLFADVFTELNKHSDIQLYFGSDHHWKPIGAYYAYVAFCKAVGFSSVPLENMDKKYKTDFLGTMYQLTKDATVKENPDDMEYFVPNVSTTAVKFGELGFEDSKNTLVFAHYSKGPNTYSTFLSGDHPLMKITTSTKNGKKAAVIKNSMGNAFTVYLISHYEEIWVVDFRYSKHNLIQLLRDNHVNDLIFAIGMNHANNPNTVRMMRRLGTQSGDSIPEKPNIVDSTKFNYPLDSALQFNPLIDTLKHEIINQAFPFITDTTINIDSIK